MLRHQPSTCTPVSGPSRSSLRRLSVPARSSTVSAASAAYSTTSTGCGLDRRRPAAGRPRADSSAIVPRQLVQVAPSRRSSSRAAPRNCSASQLGPAPSPRPTSGAMHQPAAPSGYWPASEHRGRGEHRHRVLAHRGEHPDVAPRGGGQRARSPARPVTSMHCPSTARGSSSSLGGRSSIRSLDPRASGCRRTAPVGSAGRWYIRCSSLQHLARPGPWSRRPGSARSRCRAWSRTRG